MTNTTNNARKEIVAQLWRLLGEREQVKAKRDQLDALLVRDGQYRGPPAALGGAASLFKLVEEALQQNRELVLDTLRMLDTLKDDDGGDEV